MASNALIQTRIDGVIKAEAAAVLNEMGLTVSDAVRMLLMRVARDGTLPFDPRTPNARSKEAKAELDQGKGTRFTTVEELMADLHADD